MNEVRTCICTTCEEEKPLKYRVEDAEDPENAALWDFCSAQCLRLWARLECERIMGTALTFEAE